MTEKRFTDIEHDYENAWIKCKDDGYFMIYAIYGDLDEGLPSLGDLLNGLDGTIKDLSDDYEQLLKENKELKARCEEYRKLSVQYKQKYDEKISDNTFLEKENKELQKENKHLKQELQKIYDISTVNKVKSIVDEIYDDLLYETSEESDYARKMVLKCLEKIDNFGDDLND